MILTDAQLKWLRWLSVQGGSAYIDRHKIIAQGEASIFGSEIAFLNLVAKGCIEGKGGRLVITPLGHEMLVLLAEAKLWGDIHDALKAGGA